jgi:hypothetical protein
VEQAAADYDDASAIQNDILNRNFETAVADPFVKHTQEPSSYRLSIRAARNGFRHVSFQTVPPAGFR